MNLRRVLLCVMLIAALIMTVVPAIEAQRGDVVPGQYIVVLRDFADPGLASKDMESTYGAKVRHVYNVALRGFAATIPAAQLDAARKDQRVRYIVPDRIVRIFQKTPPPPVPQQTPTGVNRIDADLSTTAKIDGIDERVNVDIAVIDTGVAAVPDINRFKFVSCLNSLIAGCVEGSGTGKGGSDRNGHGTHVAGSAAAIDNTVGVVGVAPGARIWAVQVLNAQGFGTDSDVIAGINYVAAHAGEIEVANMSLGGPGLNDNNCGRTNQDPMHEAICNAVALGVVFVVAAGNEAQDANISTPAAYPEVITVSAFADSDGQGGGLGPSTTYGPDDTIASFSNFGSAVDIAAPGVSIRSTWNNGQYVTISGTSMASPHVAGAAALYIATHGKPTDLAGVMSVRAALVALGECPLGASNTGNACTIKWPGDRDTAPAFFEPLLDAASL